MKKSEGLTVSARLLKVLHWLELGDSASAKRELAQLRPDWHDFPRLLKLKWCICASENEWEKALGWGQLLRQTVPQDATAWIQEAEALNALGRTQEAWELLLPLTGAFAKEAAIPYLLACYSGRLGFTQGAAHWLRRAVSIQPSLHVDFAPGNEPDLGCLFNGRELLGGWAGLQYN